MGIIGWALLGTKVNPNERTSNCEGLNDLDERLVIYLFLFNIVLISFSPCLWASFLAFLFLYLGLFRLLVFGICKTL